MYTLSELTEEFALIRNSSVLGALGVIVFDSGIQGPCLGVTIQTHGNEPAGLAAIRHFRKENVVEQLSNGSVVFVLNNIRAAERYFDALNVSNPDERTAAKFAARFCDLNMNRLPKNTLKISGDSRYEIFRAKELWPIWKKFDVGLDIHTTKATIDPMIIALGDIKSNLYRGFPIDIIIRNIENVQTGKPASALYGQPGITPVFGIEGGLHEEVTSFNLAIECVLTLLQNIGMLTDSSKRVEKAYKEYSVNGSVFFPNESYELVKKFKPFEPLDAGQLIAEGDGHPIKAQSKGHVLMPPHGRKPTAPLTDEVLFLSAPVKTVRA